MLLVLKPVSDMTDTLPGVATSRRARLRGLMFYGSLVVISGGLAAFLLVAYWILPAAGLSAWQSFESIVQGTGVALAFVLLLLMFLSKLSEFRTGRTGRPMELD